MSETLEYIENYFTSELSTSEKEAFENRCESDPAFAEEVAFYISARQNLRNELYAQKKREFDELYETLSSSNTLSSSKPSPGLLKTLLPYISAAAACVLLFLGWQFFNNQPSPQQQADLYIKKNLVSIGTTMGPGADSLRLGTIAFNNKNYAEAERIFQQLSSRHPYQAEAIKNLGILYLVTGRYDKAIIQFDVLSTFDQLHANQGPFYKAIALMKRSASGDVDEARSILQEVIRKDLPGSNEARTWLKNM
jgi:tetratricopeptide (TPR) repeat protein